MADEGTVVTEGGHTSVRRPGSLEKYISRNGEIRLHVISVRDLDDERGDPLQDLHAVLGKVLDVEDDVYLAGTMEHTPDDGEKPNKDEIWVVHDDADGDFFPFGKRE